MKRPYSQKKRAEKQAQTREKIVDAAIALHQKKGVAATSMDDIAKKAQVGKVTVYRHFPDEGVLVAACSGKYFQQNPFPEMAGWTQEEAATERLERCLSETYAYHRKTAPMLLKVIAEARDLPIMQPYHDHWRNVGERLCKSLGGQGRDANIIKAAIALALSFETWRLLAIDQGLSDEKAVEMMLKLILDHSS